MTITTQLESTVETALTLKQLKPQITKEHNLVESFRKKMAIHTYRLGKLLSLAKPQVEYGQWGPFLTELGISTSTDSRARKLFGLIESEDQIDGLTITEAYAKADIKIEKTSVPSNSRRAFFSVDCGGIVSGVS